jgi:hypothetical protein
MKTTVNAKITIKGETRSFPLTIDWDGLKPEEERAMAQRSLVIAYQNRHRTANKGEGSWPTQAELNVKATDHRVGQRLQVERDPVKILEAGEFTPEQLEQFAAIIRNKMKKG